jgi:hypothetical protein
MIIIIIIICLKIAANGHGLCSVWVRTSRFMRCSEEYQSLNGHIYLHFALASSGAQLYLVLMWQWTGCLRATSNIEFCVRVEKYGLKQRTFNFARWPQNIRRGTFLKQRQCGLMQPESWIMIHGVTAQSWLWPPSSGWNQGVGPVEEAVKSDIFIGPIQGCW